MAEVDIRVNGRDYRVTCEDGQEDRLNQLAAYYDRQVSELASELGQIGDARLMLLSALQICDELFEAKARAADFDQAADVLTPETLGGASRAIEAAVVRVNEIVERLDKA